MLRSRWIGSQRSQVLEAEESESLGEGVEIQCVSDIHIALGSIAVSDVQK
jgi:hypothetical protein